MELTVCHLTRQILFQFMPLDLVISYRKIIFEFYASEARKKNRKRTDTEECWVVTSTIDIRIFDKIYLFTVGDS